MSRFFLAVVALIAAFSVRADEQRIRQVIETKLNGAKIEGVQPAPVQGLFEVRFRSDQGVQILYTDARAEKLIIGSIYETKSDRNLTEERISKLSVIKFESLPFDQAVKIQRGNGKRVLAMFSDPYCPACRQFEQALQQVDDITIYVFLFPVIRPQLADHSKSVWCSADRSKAWLDLALRKKVPTAPATCDNPVEKTLELGRMLGVRATPTLFFQNGERVQGGLSAAALRVRLEETGREVRQVKK